MDVKNLRRLVDLISQLEHEAKERLGKQPDWAADRDGYHAYEDRRRKEMEAIKAHLTEHEGARFGRRPGYEVSVALAGIRSSCTGGDWGLLGNWKQAARMRIQREGGL